MEGGWEGWYAGGWPDVAFSIHRAQNANFQNSRCENTPLIGRESPPPSVSPSYTSNSFEIRVWSCSLNCLPAGRVHWVRALTKPAAVKRQDGGSWETGCLQFSC